MRAPEFWRQDGLWSRLLSPFALAFDFAGWLRWTLAKRVDVNARVICVGNLVAGGAGKTPVALAILQLLKARGVPVQALTRGHGGRLSGPGKGRSQATDRGCPPKNGGRPEKMQAALQNRMSHQ